MAKTSRKRKSKQDQISEELKLNRNMKPKFYTLKDLYNAFEFALISEGVLKSDKVYDVNNILKIVIKKKYNVELVAKNTEDFNKKKESAKADSFLL